MQKAYLELKDIFKRWSHFFYLQRIISWDEAVMMPEKSGEFRGDAMASLNQHLNEIISGNNVEKLLNETDQSELKSAFDKSNFGLMKQKHVKSKAVPKEILEKSTKSNLSAFQAWREYRYDNNWNDFLPYLKKAFNLTKEISIIKSEALQVTPYESLIQEFSPGLEESYLDNVFKKIKKELPSLRNSIIDKQLSRNKSNIDLSMPIETQKVLIKRIITELGFDLERGRLDTSHHPFCDGVPSDTRITCRYNENNFMTTVYDVIHETGHALYEQGMPLDWSSQLVGQTQSKAIHESQSLFYEYEIGHHPSFFVWLSDIVKSTVNRNFDPKDLYASVSTVSTSLIRIDADEVSYPLHVVMRYEIEKALFNEEVQIEDVPSLWDKKMQEYFGVSTQGNYKDGVMQDMHWVFGYFGYFPTYIIGQLMASQLFDAFHNLHPDVNRIIESGNFTHIRTWLKKHVYDCGSSKSGDQILHSVSNQSLDPSVYLNRIKEQYLDGK